MKIKPSDIRTADHRVLPNMSGKLTHVVNLNVTRNIQQKVNESCSMIIGAECGALIIYKISVIKYET